MAEGRLLSKRVTKSEKVAGLSSDTARMIYSWIIPFLDVDGRMEVNPKLMKGEIAPLLDHVTPDVLMSILNELHKAELIILYAVDKKNYLQLLKFDDHQPNLRKDREQKSKIPCYNKDLHTTPALLRHNSGDTPAELPHKINISKDKLREANATPEQQQPVDNSTKQPEKKPEQKAEPVPEQPAVKNAFLKETEKEFSEVMTKIKAKYDYKEQLEVENWIKANYRGKHPQALIHTLNSIVLIPHKPDVISLYLDRVMKLENQNYNYADYQKKVDDLKKPGTMSLGDIFSKCGLNLKPIPAV